MTKKLEELYEDDKLKEADDKIVAMAERFKIRKKDVILAVWEIAKDSVWAKLTLDLKEKKEAKKRDGRR